ncbi:MAG: phosphoribosylanthranilate isomerase [Opitutaceae bacterium]|nr:phosphoribosylanthranilate isomerase [Verrucomicrobiales bacterium]
MSVLVKICGITNLPDAQMAAEAGADLLGFMFYEGSTRAIPIEAAAKIIKQLPPWVVKVGVFVNPTGEEVRQAVSACSLSMLQFHGEEPPEFCTQFGIMSIKAMSIRDETSIEALPAYHTEAWLLDSYVPGQKGGTGETFNWDLAVKARKLGRPIFLAGGLNPGNVADAVTQVRPYGVDVSSGVESAPGRKDPQKVRDFISAAKSAARELAG